MKLMVDDMLCYVIFLVFVFDDVDGMDDDVDVCLWRLFFVFICFIMCVVFLYFVVIFFGGIYGWFFDCLFLFFFFLG